MLQPPEPHHPGHVFLFLKICPGWVAQLVGESSYTPEGWRFDSWSGHIPGLWIQSPTGACMGGNWLMFLSLSKIDEHILRWGLINNNYYYTFKNIFSYQKTELYRIAHIIRDNKYRGDYSKIVHCIMKSLTTLEITTVLPSCKDLVARVFVS